MAFCRFCGKEIENASRFCKYCGMNLAESDSKKDIPTQKCPPEILAQTRAATKIGKKKPWLLIGSVVLILLISLSVGLFLHPFLAQNTGGAETKIDPEFESEPEIEITLETESEPEETDPHVVDACKYVIFTNNSVNSYCDENGNMVTGPLVSEECYHFPQLNLPNGAGQEINAKIQENLNEVYSWEPWYVGISFNYEWYENGDILSIVTREETNAPVLIHDIYNISVQTGKELSTAEVLTHCGISEDTFYQKVQTCIAEYLEYSVWEQYEHLKDYYSLEEVEQIEASAYSEENMQNVKPYIGKDGQLYFKIFVPGLGQYENNYLIKFSTGEEYTIPACTIQHSDTEAIYKES